MSNKLVLVFAALCAILLTQNVSCRDVVDVDAQLPDELYILNPDSVFPVIVTDPNSPLLDAVSRQVIFVCHVQRCQQRCRQWGYRFGRCNSQAICVCSNR